MYTVHWLIQMPGEHVTDVRKSSNRHFKHKKSCTPSGIRSWKKLPISWLPLRTRFLSKITTWRIMAIWLNGWKLLTLYVCAWHYVCWTGNRKRLKPLHEKYCHPVIYSTTLTIVSSFISIITGLHWATGIQSLTWTVLLSASWIIWKNTTTHVNVFSSRSTTWLRKMSLHSTHWKQQLPNKSFLPIWAVGKVVT